MRPRLPAAALAALLTTALGHDARAGDADDIDALLNTNVVSGASKSSEAASDAPATVVTLTAEDMQKYGMRTLAEAINFLGMGLVTQDPLHSVEVGGRGVLLTADYGDHVLVLVDGHALNEAWDGTAYFEQGLGIPFELIDHVELILGPGSVLYGGNAMLGVINVVTKRARNYNGIHVVAEEGLSPQQSNGAFTSFAPKNLGVTSRVAAGVGDEFQLFGKNAEITAQIEYYTQNGPPFLWGPQTGLSDNSGQPASFGPSNPAGTWGGVTRSEYVTEVPTGYARMMWGDFTLALHAESYWRSTPYPNNFNQAQVNFDDPASYERDRWLWADLTYRKAVTNHLSIMGRLYGDTYDYEQYLAVDDASFCSLPVRGLCTQRSIGVSRWAGVEAQGTYDWFANGNLTTMLGADVRVRYAGNTENVFEGPNANPVGSLGASHQQDFPFGIYLQQRWTPFDILHLNAGARFDSDPRGNTATDSTSQFRLSPRGAVVVDVWKGGTLKGIYAEAFRPANYYEKYYEQAGELPNPNLKPETTRSVEGSFEQRFGAQRVMFGAFRSWWFDMVSDELAPRMPGNPLDVPGATQYQNVGTINNYGYNAAFDGHVGALSYGGSVTGAFTQRTTCTPSATTGAPCTSVTQPLPVAPQTYGNLRAAYDLPGALPILALATDIVGERLADQAYAFPSTLPTAPVAVGLRATISGDIPPVKGLSYRLAWDYSTASVVPYVAGPNQAMGDAVVPGTTTAQPAELAPVNRMTAFLTLRYTYPL